MAAEKHLVVDAALAQDLIDHLDLLARGGLANPGWAEKLLRRFKTAVATSATAPADALALDALAQIKRMQDYLVTRGFFEDYQNSVI
jgi:hypothetical protein